MAQASLNNDQLQEAIDAYHSNGEVKTAAARALGINSSTYASRLKMALAKGFKPGAGDKVELPSFPDSDIDAEEILDHMEKRFDQRWEHEQATKWFEVKIPEDKPVALAVVGDPHLGSNGCNVKLLRRDVDLLKSTHGVLAVNIGDAADNWSQRLVHLYAENDVSRQTERRLARWFLEAVPWKVWVFGNHDNMHGEFATYLKTLNAQKIPMLDWEAKFRICFPNGRECRVDASHNHKGTSIYNKLHGQKRTSLWRAGEAADIVVGGHHHNCAIQQEELDDGRFVTLARARGYKFIDDHASVNGFPSIQQGATVLFTINPHAESAADFVHGWLDLKAGCEYLEYLRG